MKKMMLAVIAVMCLVGFSSLSFAADMGEMKDKVKEKVGEMKDKMKGDGMKDDGMKDKMKEKVGEMKDKMGDMKDKMKEGMGK